MGEISNKDLFGKSIINTVRQLNLQRNLEIGSWDGTGSTQCFIEGMKDLTAPDLTCIEVKKDRYLELVENTKKYNWVKCINESTISQDSFVYNNFNEIWTSPFNHIKAERDLVKTWYDEDVASIAEYKLGYLERDETIYDGVLIDGGEFFGYSEYLLVKDRCNVLFLDDYYNAFKTRQAVEELSADLDWEVVAGDNHTRNGFAVFKRKVFLQ